MDAKEVDERLIVVGFVVGHLCVQESGLAAVKSQTAEVVLVVSLRIHLGGFLNLLQILKLLRPRGRQLLYHMADNGVGSCGEYQFGWKGSE